VANGSVVSTLSTNADGSQTFPNGLYSQANIIIGTGSYVNVGQYQIGRRGTNPDMNVVLGIDIMPSLTSGEGNVGIGRSSLYKLTTGSENIAIGDQAGFGISGSNSNNITIGYATAMTMTGSNVSNNIFIGSNAAGKLNNGYYNVGIGDNALNGVVDTNDVFIKSTALGYGAGAYLSGNSSNNLLLGANAGPISSTTESYKFYVSNGDYESQPYMSGSMGNTFRTLDINAQTVTISGSVLPNTTDVFQLGSTSKMWKTVIATSISGAIAATNGVVSGSSQITYASISSIPAGIVSGSSQVTGIGNAQLTNSSTTIGTTAIALGASSTTLVGLTSVTSTAFVGALTGNASTVTTNANLTGNVTSVGNATTIASGVVTSDMIVDGTIVNGDINASAAIVDTKLATISTGGKVSNSATTATSANTVSAIVARDGSGNFSAGTITAALTGNASTATTAAALTTARTINGTSFDGSANITIPNLVSGSAQVTLSSTTGGGTASNVQFNSLGIGMAASATAGRIDASNDVVAFSTSDIRFKENIVPIENALDKISKISGNTYDWKVELKDVHGYEGNDVGVIAQEIEAVLPQLVQDRDNGYKAVKYDKLVALLIEGIKEQQTQIHSLTIEIEKLKESKGL